MATPKTYPNKHENRFAQLAHTLGWRVTKQGWPDFVCYDDDSGQAIFVEVKPRGQALSEYQFELMKVLSRLGAKCFISDGRTLGPFDPELPQATQRGDVVKGTEHPPMTKEEYVANFTFGMQKWAAELWEAEEGNGSTQQ